MIEKQMKKKTGEALQGEQTEIRKHKKTWPRRLGTAAIVVIASFCFFMLYGKKEGETSDFFYDAEFGHTVRMILHVSDDTPAEELLPLMKQTESLYLFGGIKSLEDLKYFPNLKTLSLNIGNQFDYVNNYSETIERLYLEDVSGIVYAKDLEELEIADQNLGDLSFLDQLNKLEKLNLYSCTFDDPGPIGNCTSLTDLRLWRNSLVQLDFLTPLVNLKKLDLLENDTEFAGLRVLGNLTKMEDLFLYNSGIHDIDFVRNMPNLNKISVMAGDITDVEPLSGHKKLESINLSNNWIWDISALQDLESLKYLFLDGNQISDISQLAEMKELRSLSIDNNSVADISPLKELPELRSLSMGGNPVTDISWLSQVGNLTILTMDSSVIERIQDITPLFKIPNMSLHSFEEKRDFEISYALDESMAENEEIEIWCQENLSNLRYYKVDDVSCGDLDEDGIEDAAIVLSYGTEERTLSGRETYPWKQKVLVFKRDSRGKLHKIEELEIKKRLGISQNQDDYAYTNTLLRNGSLIIQETNGNSRSRKWQTTTRCYDYENGETQLLQFNQYDCAGAFYEEDYYASDRVIMVDEKEDSREEFMLTYDENDPLSKCWRKVPMVRDCPPDVVFYGEASMNYAISPDGFSWNYVEKGERKRTQETRYDWKPSAKSPKEPVHPLFPIGADNRSREILPMVLAEGADSAEVYLECGVCPDRITVFGWLFSEKSEDGMGYYTQPWPDSQQTFELSNDMPVVLSLKPDRLYEIIMIWDGGDLERKAYSGEAQYLLETR